jgi:Zn-dependent M28 family amino/carboxypeptidase
MDARATRGIITGMVRAVAGLVVVVVGCGGRSVVVPAAGETGAKVAVAARPDPLSEASIIADLTWLTAPERHGRGSLTADARATADWLIGELDDAGYTALSQPIADAPGQINVVAIHAGTAPAVMVTAHYDHLGEIGGVMYPGADDNASGVAIVLAVARDLARRTDVPGEVVVVFTGAEELGLFGATTYADAPAVPLDQIRLEINLDLVGRSLFASATGKDNVLGAMGLDGANEIEAAAAATAAGLELLTVSPGLVSFIGQDFRTDDWVFRARGVPAIHLSTGLHEDYHQPTDTLDKLSRPQLVRITAFLRDFVGRIAR